MGGLQGGLGVRLPDEGLSYAWAGKTAASATPVCVLGAGLSPRVAMGNRVDRTTRVEPGKTWVYNPRDAGNPDHLKVALRS